jgi:hypothetical protein
VTNQNEYFKTPAQIYEDLQKSVELQEYTDKLFATVNQLTQENEQLKAELSHLKNLLNAIPKGNLLSAQPLTEEELICLEQITRLKNSSEQRELTLDEVKKLDLLHKNLKIIRDNAIIDVKPAKQKALSNEKLLAIVAKKPESNE